MTLTSTSSYHSWKESKNVDFSEKTQKSEQRVNLGQISVRNVTWKIIGQQANIMYCKPTVQCWNAWKQHWQLPWCSQQSAVSIPELRPWETAIRECVKEFTCDPRDQSSKHYPSESRSVSASSEINESSGVMAMSPVGWEAICCRRFSDWSSLLVQSWHDSSMPSPSPPYSGGKTGGEKKSLKVSWKSAPCMWIYRGQRGNLILKVCLKAFLLSICM